MVNAAVSSAGDAGSVRRHAEMRSTMRSADNGQGLCVLSVPDMHCGGCVSKIERVLNARPDILSARVNLTLKQVRVLMPRADADPGPVVDALQELGFKAGIAETTPNNDDPTGKKLLRATAVAGFGASNVMLYSVGVWSGAEGTTREVFHWISALIALPVIIYSGRPFFSSAWSAIRARQLNMDVPISLGVILATILSLFELANQGEHVFFDAGTTLLFFLLAGRYLDHMMRQRARSAVDGLLRLSPKGAMLRQADGSVAFAPLDQIRPDDVLVISPNEYVPVDLRITAGSTDLDRSLITGESMPVASGPGDTLEAGTLNLTGNIEAVALRSADKSFLAQMIEMQAAAEQGRGTYVRIADRAAQLYAPLVHLTAIFTFIGWMIATAGDWQASAFVAISVLIITCPCALGLAVPVAHVVAAGRMLSQGILMKDGSALERMAEIEGAVFDKTGTLTTGRPQMGAVTGDAALVPFARALAAHSNHPASLALAPHPEAAKIGFEVTDIEEFPGLGVSGRIDGRPARLGRRDWVAEIAAEAPKTDDPSFAFEGGMPVSFALDETLRPGAQQAVSALQAEGLPVSMLSGDNKERVGSVAGILGITDAHSGMTPDGKIGFLEEKRLAGQRLLMVGDGLNDAAALAAAHVSMAPSSASDAGRMASDFVFLREGLDAVPAARDIALRTARTVRQNFALAIIYNCIAIPLAIMGYATPLMAALAMSISSVIVIANSLRLNGVGKRNRKHQAATQALAVPA